MGLDYIQPSAATRLSGDPRLAARALPLLAEAQRQSGKTNYRGLAVGRCYPR